MQLKSHQRKKILYVITKSNLGGAQRYVLELATTLKEEFEIKVILGGKGELVEKLHQQEIQTIEISSLQRDVGFLKDIKSLISLIKVFKKEKPDIVHLNSSKAGLLGATAGRIINVPKVIFTGHGWSFNEQRSFISKRILFFLHWITVFLCHKTVAVSEKTKKDISKLPFVNQKIEVIYNGINLDKNFLDGFEAREKLAPNINKSLWIGTIAELHKNKGLDIAIRSFLELKKAFPEICWVIIGEGEQRNKLEDMIKKLNLTDTVYLVGHKKDAYKFLKAFDLFLLPSRTEAFPYVILEAGLAEIPIVASCVGGIPEIVKDKETGIIANPSSKDIVTKIKSCLEDKQNKILVTKMKKCIEDRLSKEIMVKNTKEIYN